MSSDHENADDQRDEEYRAFAVMAFVGDALDPEKLLPLIPLTKVWWKRKGDALGRPFNGRVPVAKTGVCSYSTTGSGCDGNDQVALLLRAIEPRIEDIRRVVTESELRWKLEFFEGNIAGHRFADLKPELFTWAERLGVLLILGIDSNITPPPRKV
jgi:hypothetical protein